jgi:hypothetical protein
MPQTEDADAQQLLAMLCGADIDHSYEIPAGASDDDQIEAIELPGIARFEFDPETGDLLRVAAQRKGG